jgi:chromate reductase, NAD(P)H dehydrogenase (quinone)
MKSVRVLTICGSLQPMSANRAVLESVAANLRGHGATVDDFGRLAEVPAFAPGTSESAAVHELRTLIASSDVVVVASPEYAGGMAGALKNALDWIVGSGELYEKLVSVMSAGTTGGLYARQQLVRTLTWQGAFVIEELGIASPRRKIDDTGVVTDDMTIADLRAFASLIVRKAKLPPHIQRAEAEVVAARLGIEPRS